jgi:SET domain-containing protein
MTERDFGDVVVKPSPINGLGVFAARDFKQGELIFETSELRRVTEEEPLREGEEERHCDWLADGRQIYLPEPGRYINHSCDPNIVKEYRNVVRRCEVARRDIRAGEELTHDYCIDGFGDVVWECNCRIARCRKVIHSDFFELPLELKIEYLPYLSDLYKEVFRDKLGRLGQEMALTRP